jgi:hypothetical protein
MEWHEMKMKWRRWSNQQSQHFNDMGGHKCQFCVCVGKVSLEREKVGKVTRNNDDSDAKPIVIRTEGVGTTHINSSFIFYLYIIYYWFGWGGGSMRFKKSAGTRC